MADFGLSREEMVERHAADVRGTFGYLDPEYISTRAFTKKSDVYSFGVLLFELVAGRNPQQGLMDYIDLVSDHKAKKNTCHFFVFYEWFAVIPSLSVRES